MSINRANLPGAGAPRVTYNEATLWTRDDVLPRIAHELSEQRSSFYGRVTKTRAPRVIRVSLPVFSLWESLGVLFPPPVLDPVIGSRVFTGADVPLVLHARNGDRLTLHNARITGLSNLRLAANQPVFSGVAEFTGLIKNNARPVDAAAYYTYDNAAYTEAGFGLTNFIARAWTGAWGARTGFGNIQTQDGWDVAWELGMEEDVVDGLGVVDMFISNFGARASCIPVGPTMAQIESNLFFQGTPQAAIGAGAHESVDHLTLTSGTSSVVLRSAALVETGLAFAPARKRITETVWETMRGFTTGIPQAIATIT